MRKNYFIKKHPWILLGLLLFGFTAFTPLHAQTFLLNENFNAGGLPAGWTVVDRGNTSYTWEHNPGTNFQTLNGTGYMRVDSDAAGPGAITVDEDLLTPVIDATGYGNLTLRYEDFFQSLGGLEDCRIEVFNGNSWVIIYEFGNVNEGAWGNPVIREFDVSAYANSQFQVRFHYDDNGGWLWYYSIDNVQLFTIDNDLAPTEVTAPASCDFTTSTPVDITICNRGNNDIPAAQATYFLYDPDGDVVSAGVYDGGLLAAGACATFTVNVDPVSRGFGVYELRVLSIFPNDQIPENDDFRKLIPYTEPVDFSKGGYVEDFSQGTTYGTTARLAEVTAWTFEPYQANYENAGSLAEYLTAEAPGTWHIVSGWTGLGYTDPTEEFLWYYPDANAADDWAMTPCFELEGGTYYEFKFNVRNGTPARGKEELSLWAGNDPSSSAMDILISDDVNPVINGWEERKYTFFLVEDGIYHFGFHINSIGGRSLIGIDDIEVNRIPAHDVAVTNLRNTCIGKTATFRVDVTNFGSSAKGGTFEEFEIGYRVKRAQDDSYGPALQTIYDGSPIAGFGRTLSYEFSAFPYSFAQPGEYDVQFFPVLTNSTDEEPLNDTLEVRIESLDYITSFPYRESFETGTGGWTSAGIQNQGFPATIRNSWAVGQPRDYIRTLDQTPGVDENYIDRASDGDNAWVTNLSGYHPFEEFSFVASPVFDFSSMSDPVMSFDLFVRLNNNDGNSHPYQRFTWWSRDFEAGVVMQASTNCGRSWETIGTDEDFSAENWYDQTLLGNGFIQGINTPAGPAFNNGYWGDLYTEWKNTGLFDLKRYAGEEDVRFRFLFFSDHYSTNATDEGFAFDNVVIREKPPKNVGVREILTASGCEGTELDVTVVLENQGRLTQRNFPVAFFIDGALERTEIFNREILAGEQETFQFSLPYIPTATNFDLSVSTQLAGDEDPANNLKTVSVQISEVNDQYPVIADFDAWANKTTAAGATNILLQDGWQNSQDDDRDWTVHNGSTGSGGTGPSSDHTQGTSAGKYLYIETSIANPLGQEAILMLPCIDLAHPDIPETEFPSMSFWYHMWGANMGSLALQVAVDGGAYQTVWEKAGDQGNQWLNADVSLAAYKGKTIQARFLGVLGSDFTSDMALDDISISTKYDNDLEVVGIDGPVGGCILTEDIPIRIANKGYAPQQGFRLGYTVHAVYSDGTEADFYTSVETDLYIGPNPDTELEYSFSAGEAFDFTKPGTYTIRAFPELANDRVFVNDTTPVFTLVSYPKPVVPQVDILGPTSFCEGAATVDMQHDTRWDRDKVYTEGDWVTYRPAGEVVPAVYACIATPLNRESPDSTDYWQSTAQWSASRDYQQGDWVAFSASGNPPYTAFVCTQTPPNGENPLDLAYWQNAGLTIANPGYSISHKWVYGELDSISGSNRLRNAERYMVDGQGPHRYQLTVRNNFGCNASSEEIELREFPLPEVDIETNGFVLTAQVTGVTANIKDYTWYNGAGNVVPEAQSRSSWIVREPGAYSVAVEDERGCRDTSEAVVANITAIDQDLTAEGINIWPNPASDALQIDLGALAHSEGTTKVEVLDNTGRQVATWDFAAGTWQDGAAVPVAKLASGAYTLKVTTAKGSATARFIKTVKR